MPSAFRADPSYPRVSIILPTFNRAGFLPQALAAISSQTYDNWELIIVDDGSSDESGEIVRGLAQTIPQAVHYTWQKNAGAYAARNRGLDLAHGAYVAFYDSDDVWMPHHLTRCARALDNNADVDWVYGASSIIDFTSGRLILPHSFAVGNEPQPFRRLHVSTRQGLYVVDDPQAVECAIVDGLYCGLQNSVIRATVFRELRFHTAYCEPDGEFASLASSSSAEDQLFTVRALKRGHRLAYFDDVHVQYYVHDANSSASAVGDRTVERQLLTYAPIARGFEELREEYVFNRRERRAIARRLGREYFWHIGYTILWAHGRRREALASFERGLRQWPWSPRCWKTYALARLRAAVGPSVGASL